MTDLIILGNGMAGMTAALYAKRANLDFKIVGRDAYDFGQIGEAILVENYPCVPNKSGFDLAVSLYDQLMNMGVEVEEHEIVKVGYKYRLDSGSEKTLLVKYADGSSDEAKSVIYALGAKHRPLICQGMEDAEFHYCALCDGAFFKDKSVAVIGGGDSAFTQAEYLSKICKKVDILMCDENITASPTTVNRVMNTDNIEITKNFPVTRIDKLSNYKIMSDGIDRYFSVDGIFVAIGMSPNSQALDITPWARNLNTGEIHGDENGKTHYPGFFVAGDVREKKVRQSITAAADGANAVQSVIDYLNSLKG